MLAGADDAAGAELGAELPELVEAEDPLVEPAVSEELFDALSLAPLLPLLPAALSAAVTAGAASLVLAPPLSPPPLLRKSVTYQPEPLS